MVSSSDPYLGKQVERHVHVSMCKLRAMNLVSTFLLQATMKATQHNPMTRRFRTQHTKFFFFFYGAFHNDIRLRECMS